MLNHVVLMGRLTKDPELRRTGSGVAVTSFRIAVDRNTKAKDAEKPETDFFDCVAWRSTAEFIDKFFAKGRMIVVDGELRQRGFTTKEGERRQTVEIEAENVFFGDSKRSGNSGEEKENSYSKPTGNENGGGTDGYQHASNGPSTDFTEIEDEDAQLPF